MCYCSVKLLVLGLVGCGFAERHLTLLVAKFPSRCISRGCHRNELASSSHTLLACRSCSNDLAAQLLSWREVQSLAGSLYQWPRRTSMSSPLCPGYQVTMVVDICLVPVDLQGYLAAISEMITLQAHFSFHTIAELRRRDRVPYCFGRCPVLSCICVCETTVSLP